MSESLFLHQNKSDLVAVLSVLADSRHHFLIIIPSSHMISNCGILCESGYIYYRRVPKFSDTRKLCCNLPKSLTKRPNLRVLSQEDANVIANSKDPDQTAPRRLLL